MNLRKSYWEKRESSRSFGDEPFRIPGIMWRTLLCLFVFFALLGIKNAEGFGPLVVSTAKESVNKDLSYQDAVAAWTKVKETLLKLPQLDIGAFWTKAVTGEPLQLAWPTEGQVTSYFGWRPNPTGPGMSLHQGIDIDATKGTEVVSALDGVVKEARKSPEYGNMVEIEHKGAFTTVYGHLDEIKVQTGQKVKKGQVIGTVGDTGNALGSHLHFEVRKDGLEVDPMTLLPPRTKEP